MVSDAGAEDQDEAVRGLWTGCQTAAKQADFAAGLGGHCPADADRAGSVSGAGERCGAADAELERGEPGTL